MRNILSEIKKLLASEEQAARYELAAGKSARIQCARSGTFVGMGRKKVTFTPESLGQIAARFSLDREHLAKIGHAPILPETPHYGDVRGIEYDAAADRLWATVEPTEVLVEKNRKEGFRRVSMELSAHPEGGYDFEDLGFLAAHKPAIGGLDPVALAADETTEGRAVFVFADGEAPDVPEEEVFEFALSEKRPVKEKLAGGLDKSGTDLTSSDSANKSGGPEMDENQKELEALKLKLAEAEKAKDAAEKRSVELAESIKAGVNDRVKVFMSANSKKLPMLLRKAGIEPFLTAGLLAEAGKSTPDRICFAGVDKQDQNLSLVEGFMFLLAALPDQVSEDEGSETARTGAEDGDAGGADVIPIGRVRGIKFAADDDLDKRVLAHIAAEKAKNPASKITYTEASEIVAAQGTK